VIVRPPRRRRPPSRDLPLGPCRRKSLDIRRGPRRQRRCVSRSPEIAAVRGIARSAHHRRARRAPPREALQIDDALSRERSLPVASYGRRIHEQRLEPGRYLRAQDLPALPLLGIANCGVLHGNIRGKPAVARPRHIKGSPHYAPYVVRNIRCRKSPRRVLSGGRPERAVPSGTSRTRRRLRPAARGKRPETRRKRRAIQGQTRQGFRE
jgi:hypothetical protein